MEIKIGNRELLALLERERACLEACLFVINNCWNIMVRVEWDRDDEFVELAFVLSGS